VKVLEEELNYIYIAKVDQSQSGNLDLTLKLKQNGY
jgi:hypothetical protein